MSGTATRANTVSTASRRRRTWALEAHESGDAALLVDLDEPLTEVKSLLEERERASPGVEFTQVTRKRLDEARRRGDERWDHERTSAAKRATTRTIAAARASEPSLH